MSVIGSSPQASSSPQPPASLFQSASSIAAAAGRRAAAAASAATSPSLAQTTQVAPTTQTDRPGGQASTSTEVRCVEGYGNNLYVGGSDGVVEWWVCDGTSGSDGVSNMAHSIISSETDFLVERLGPASQAPSLPSPAYQQNSNISKDSQSSRTLRYGNPGQPKAA
jgi:hypothetical protein